MFSCGAFCSRTLVRGAVDRARRDGVRADRALVLGDGPVHAAGQRCAVLRPVPGAGRVAARSVRHVNRDRGSAGAAGAAGLVGGSDRLCVGSAGCRCRLGSCRRCPRHSRSGARLCRSADDRVCVSGGDDAGALVSRQGARAADTRAPARPRGIDRAGDLDPPAGCRARAGAADRDRTCGVVRARCASRPPLRATAPGDRSAGTDLDRPPPVPNGVVDSAARRLRGRGEQRLRPAWGGALDLPACRRSIPARHRRPTDRDAAPGVPGGEGARARRRRAGARRRHAVGVCLVHRSGGRVRLPLRRSPGRARSHRRRTATARVLRGVALARDAAATARHLDRGRDRRRHGTPATGARARHTDGCPGRVHDDSAVAHPRPHLSGNARGGVARTRDGNDPPRGAAATPRRHCAACPHRRRPCGHIRPHGAGGGEALTLRSRVLFRHRVRVVGRQVCARPGDVPLRRRRILERRLEDPVLERADPARSPSCPTPHWRGCPRRRYPPDSTAVSSTQAATRCRAARSSPRPRSRSSAPR